MDFLKNFKFSILSFSLKGEEKFRLPVFWGTTVRGGFGYSFKKTVCFSKQKIDCQTCILEEKCPYSLIFEGRVKKEKWKIKETPKPFVIEIPFPFKSSENLNFNLILIGNATDFFPYFFLAFSNLGEMGIGKRRVKYEIEKIEQIYYERKMIYHQGNKYIEKIEPYPLKLDENWEGKEITLNFQTPLRIKYGGRYIAVLEFQYLIKSLIRRIKMLSYFWCDIEEFPDFTSLIEESEKVKIKKCELKWVDFERYSTRQNQKMKLGGIIGKIEYSGEIKKFFPLLKLGQYIHIGKNTTFGFGKYQILKNSP